MDAVVMQGVSQTRVGKRRRKDLRLKRLNAELLVAVENGDRSEVVRTLVHGANPNATCCPSEVSVVQIASLDGHVDILRHLLDAGAKVEAGDMCERSAAHFAAWGGHTECLRLLLARSPGLVAGRVAAERMECDVIPQEWHDTHRHDHAALRDKLPRLEPGSTPLHVACHVASLDCVEVLLEAGASLSAVDDCLMTPLDVVGEKLVADRRLQDDADAVKVTPRTGGTESFTRCIRRLLARGAKATTETKAMGRFRETAMHTAIELSAIDAIPVLARAGAAALYWDRHGATPTHLAVARRLEEPLKVLLHACGSDEHPVVDVVDIKGYTALHKAVIGQWPAGVNVLLEVGADVEAKTPLGETVLHLAAEKGNAEILAELLKIPDYDSTELKILNTGNNKGETPLFRAVFGGNIECVRMLLEAKADVEVKMAYEFTLLHRAVELNQPAILELLLQQHEPPLQHPLIEAMDTARTSGLTPLLMAAEKGYIECVRTLLRYGCNTRARVAEKHGNALAGKGETALHLASLGGFDAVVAVLLEHDRSLVAERDEADWRPIHAAAFQGHREAVRTLITNGAELSARCTLKDNSEQSALDLIVGNITRPVGFLEEVLDACITTNRRPINDLDSEIVLDYSILYPRGDVSNQMKVIDALTLTGNHHGQHTLFLHPLVASFLFLKWRKLSGFFYGLMTLYLVFVFSFTMLGVMMYYYQDTEQDVPFGMDIDAVRYVVVVVTAVLLLLEVASVIQVPKMYLTDVETWIKTVSFVLTLVVCAYAGPVNDSIWLRDVTTLALLLAWMQFLFLISRVPRFGSFILMFTRVTGNVIGVLLAFLFLMFGFSLTFMIQFHAQAPFTDPWNAFAKTFMMMTGEFDYSGLFESGSDGSRMLMAQLIFLVFVVFIGISMMNLLIGMAVSDIADLEVKGTITRFKKQAEFLSMLEKVVFSALFFKCFPKRWAQRVNRRRQVAASIKIRPGLPRKELEKVLPSAVVETILVRLGQTSSVEGDPTLTDVYKSVQTLARNVDYATGARIRPSDHIDATDVAPIVGDLAARMEVLCREVEELRMAVERTQRVSVRR